MRILHVIHTLNPASGGTAEAVRNFVLHPFSSRQSVLTLDHPSDPWTKSYATPLYCVGPGKGNYGYSRMLATWLRANTRRYDALVIHGCWQYHSVAASTAARRANIPYFIFPHGMLDPYFNRVSYLKYLKKLFYWHFEKAVLENAQAVLFTCEEERQRAHRGFRFSVRDHVTPLGISGPPRNIDHDREIFLDRFPHIKGKRVVLFLGRLHPKKGVDLLIKAFARITDRSLHLVIAGPPASETYDRHLQSLAATRPDSVTFTGMLTGALKNGAIAAAEVLSLPSHQENFGLSVVEALALGRPVLISDQVNIWREIIQESAGFSAPDTEQGALKLLQQWQNLTPEEVQRMSHAALGCFERRFRADSASTHFLKTLRECRTQSDEQSSFHIQPVHA